MEYYPGRKRNEFDSVLVRWMNLEPVTQSEVSQKEKNKYCILMYIYEIEKDGTDEHICRAAMSCRQRIDLWTQGRGVREEGEGGIYGESNTETYITICKIDSQ